MRVAIHEAIDKADGIVFRCTLSGSAADRWLEVPAWMFDRARCLDPPRLTASPFVSMDALSVLSDLLRQALKPPLSFRRTSLQWPSWTLASHPTA
jgi:hypothetical protein